MDPVHGKNSPISVRSVYGCEETSGLPSVVLTDTEKTYQRILEKIIKDEWQPGRHPGTVLMDSLDPGSPPI